MSSQLRVNKSENRSGLGTITYTDSGPIVSGIVTANSFSGGLPITSGSSWRVVTSSDASTLKGETNLQFDGTNLYISDNIIHKDDTNTKIGFPAVDTFTVETAGSERLRIDNSGNVNIGAAAANTTIHASGLFNGATPKYEIKLGAAANSYTRLINITNPGAQTNSETLGRVGIKLSLGSEANSGESNKSGIIYAESTSGYNNAVSLCLATNNTEKLRITSAGNIGVGNASPSTKLSLEGSAGSTSHGILIGPKHSGGIRGVVEVHSAADTIGFNLSRTGGGSDTDIVLLRNVSSGGVIEARNSSNVSKVYLNSSGSSYLLEGLGVGVASPMNRFQCGSHTFSGSHGMYNNGRVGMSNHGELTGLMLASIYNDSNHPEYGVVFVQGPSTSSYNVWGICPDGPAKGNSLNLHYGAQNTNIHAPTNQKFEFTGEGYLRKPKHPSFLARRSTAGDGRSSASPITEWSTNTTAPCHNIGGHFNASTGKFTAPVAGMYHFSACPGYKQNGQNFNIKFRIDNTDAFEPVRFIDGGDDLTSHSTSSGSITVYLNVNQTMSVCIAYTHHVNTDYNFFSGHLVG